MSGEQVRPNNVGGEIEVVEKLATRLGLSAAKNSAEESSESILVSAVASRCMAGSPDEVKALLGHIRAVLSDESMTRNPKGLRFIATLLALILHLIGAHQKLAESKNVVEEIKAIADECAARSKACQKAPPASKSVNVAKLMEAATAFNAVFHNGIESDAKIGSAPISNPVSQFKAHLSAAIARVSGDDITRLKALLALFVKRYGDSRGDQDSILVLEILLSGVLHLLAQKHATATHGQHNDLASLTESMETLLRSRDAAQV